MTTETLRPVQAGAVYSRQSFGTVLGIDPCDPSGAVHVRNDEGVEWTISREIFDAEFVVADQVGSEQTVNQTELLELITKNPRTAMTIHFRKKLDPANVLKKVRLRLEDDPSTSRAFGQFLKEELKGEPRTMIGRHYGEFDDRGRLQFIEHRKGMRLVDPRTVEFAIIRGVRYSTS